LAFYLYIEIKQLERLRAISRTENNHDALIIAIE